MESITTPEELEKNLQEYKQQLDQVEQLLLLDPENEEYSEMYNGLAEVIELTEELLRDAQEQHQQQQQATTSYTGQAPPAWAIGSRCQAHYSTDEQWYEATVKAVTVDGKFVVTYDGYGNEEEVTLQGIRPVPEASEVYRGVSAPKRKRVEEEPLVTEIPKWLVFKETDDEKTKARKKKLMKSYKSKIRFQEMDLQQKQKAGNWQQFVTGKGAKKRAGFMSGYKKDSIFKVPEGINAKVGVVNSGKGMTDYSKRSRHEFGADD